jgi:hypothetical protein
VKRERGRKGGICPVSPCLCADPLWSGVDGGQAPNQFVSQWKRVELKKIEVIFIFVDRFETLLLSLSI